MPQRSLAIWVRIEPRKQRGRSPSETKLSLPTGSITVNRSPFAKAAAKAPISVSPPLLTPGGPCPVPLQQTHPNEHVCLWRSSRYAGHTQVCRNADGHSSSQTSLNRHGTRFARANRHAYPGGLAVDIRTITSGAERYCSAVMKCSVAEYQPEALACSMVLAVLGRRSGQVAEITSW
jgi:hypothetical protein